MQYDQDLTHNSSLKVALGSPAIRRPPVMSSTTHPVTTQVLCTWILEYWDSSRTLFWAHKTKSGFPHDFVEVWIEGFDTAPPNLQVWMMHLYSALLCIVVQLQSCVCVWGGGLSSTTTSVQHPLVWYDGCHRTTVIVLVSQFRGWSLICSIDIYT